MHMQLAKRTESIRVVLIWVHHMLSPRWVAETISKTLPVMANKVVVDYDEIGHEELEDVLKTALERQHATIILVGDFSPQTATTKRWMILHGFLRQYRHFHSTFIFISEPHWGEKTSWPVLKGLREYVQLEISL